jgi:hypothetical protein
VLLQRESFISVSSKFETYDSSQGSVKFPVMMYVVSNHKLALIDVKTLKQGQAVKMCLVPQHNLAVLLLGLLIYAPLNNEKYFPHCLLSEV